MPIQTVLDPFSSKNILNLSGSINVVHDVLQHEGFDRNPEPGSLRLADIEKIGLPKLTADVLRLRLNETPLEQIDSSEGDADTDKASNDAQARPTAQGFDDDDPWCLPLPCEDVSRQDLLHTWDKFQGFLDGEAQMQLLSEADNRRYDALLAQHWRQSNGSALRFAESDHLWQALVNVVVGRSSAFFIWHEENNEFASIADDFAATGHSAGLIAALCKALCRCGSLFKTIKLFCTSTETLSATYCALQSSIHQILHAIEHDFMLQRPAPQSFLDLQNTANQYVDLLEVLECLTKSARSCNNESDLLIQGVQLIDDAWHANVHLQPLLSQLTSEVVIPTFHSTAQQLDLCFKQSDSPSDDGWLLRDLLSNLNDIFMETIECLASIKHHASDRTPLFSNDSPIRMIQQWSDLTELEERLARLEKRRELELPTNGSSPTIDSTTDQTHSSSAATALPDPFDIDFTFPMKLALNSHAPLRQTNSLHHLTIRLLQGKRATSWPDIAPSMAIRISVEPFLTTQHRTSSTLLLKMLFVEHHIVSHLKLLYNFHLLGDGVFATRLSRALFDSDQNSAQSRSKTGLTAGLRLEDREAWPPASSELRLVLMGLLSSPAQQVLSKDAIESISFAIRDLDDDELEACRNVHSIHALDFLRLSYAAPNPILELIITPEILDKYDTVFKFLLVLMRLHSLSQSMMAQITCYRGAVQPLPTHHKFCVEFHHFVSQVLDFALNIAITVPWANFETHVTDISNYLSAGRCEEGSRRAGSTAQLRRSHEDALDQMLKTLLLKRKQVKAYQTLCSILSAGLEYSSPASSQTDSHDTLPFYNQFRSDLTSWLAEITKLVNTSQDPALRRLIYLLLSLDKFEHYSGDMGQPQLLQISGP